MNKYQECLLSKLGFILCSVEELSDVSQTIRSKASIKKKDLELDKTNGVLIVKQYEDITITKYALILGKEVVKALNKLYVLKSGEWTEISITNINTKNSFGHTFGFDNPQGYIVPIDFDDKADKLKMTFVNSIADEYVIDLKFVEADKDLYYQKQEADQKARMLQSAQIKHSTGTDLINIYFQPCCSDYEYTEIYLYIPQDYVTVGGPYGPVKKPSSWQLFKKCKIPSEDFYKSINGLAYGTYAYVVKQYDKKDNLLMQTEYIEFTLNAPKQPIMGRLNRI